MRPPREVLELLWWICSLSDVVLALSLSLATDCCRHFAWSSSLTASFEVGWSGRLEETWKVRSDCLVIKVDSGRAPLRRGCAARPLRTAIDMYGTGRVMVMMLQLFCEASQRHGFNWGSHALRRVSQFLRQLF